MLVPAVLLFSLLSALSGMAAGLVSLLLIRAVMGASEGAVASTGVAVAVEASHPKRRGMNNGLFQCGFALFGLAIAPIVATQLLQVTSWRNVFLIVGIPGIFVAVLMWFTVREPLTIAAAQAQTGKRARRCPRCSRHRNVLLAMVTLLCAMTGVFVMAALMPSYLVDFLKLTGPQMGLRDLGHWVWRIPWAVRCAHRVGFHRAAAVGHSSRSCLRRFSCTSSSTLTRAT